MNIIFKQNHLNQSKGNTIMLNYFITKDMKLTNGTMTILMTVSVVTAIVFCAW